MTLSDAIENPGAPVIYTHPATGEIELGIVQGIGPRGLVNVQYGPKVWATHPANLRFDRSRR